MSIDIEQMAADYPYGVCSTHLKKALEWISENVESPDLTTFSSPDFLGMPKELSKKLSHGDIDYIQLYGNDYTYVASSELSP